MGGAWQLRALKASSFCDTWEAHCGAHRLFVKSCADAVRARMLAAEADGLRALAATGTIRVPEVALLADGGDGPGALLALEWLELVPPDTGFGERFGRALAALHAAPCPLQPPAFGWRRDNFIGATPQGNTPAPDWPTFFGKARLGAMRTRLAAAAAPELLQAIDTVIAQLPDLLPGDAKPSLIQGDLWQGNWGMLADGTPVTFDPAVSCSDAGAELAMMRLFGAPPPGFDRAYAQASGRGEEDERCLRVYQLYHLLNHAVLFGGGYHAQALGCAREVLRP